MAKKRVIPTQKKLQLTRTSGSSSNFTLIDVGKVLSQQNRRLYRQGRNYRCKVELIDDNEQSNHSVYVLSDTWVNHLAWKKAFEAYMNATKEEREMLGPRVARWNDFRVKTGFTVPGGVPDYAPVVYDPTGSAQTLNVGEFNLSTVELDAGDKEFSWGAGSPTEFGILEELEKAFNTEASPQIIEVNQPYSDIDGDQMNLDQFVELQEEGDQPPYDSTNFPDPWVRIDVLRSNLASGGKRATDWFNAPCGFIIVQTSAGGDDTKNVELTVASGDYKGVMAPSMGVAKLTPDKKYIVK